MPTVVILSVLTIIEPKIQYIFILVADLVITAGAMIIPGYRSVCTLGFLIVIYVLLAFIYISYLALVAIMGNDLIMRIFRSKWSKINNFFNDHFQYCSGTTLTFACERSVDAFSLKLTWFFAVSFAALVICLISGIYHTLLLIKHKQIIDSEMQRNQDFSAPDGQLSVVFVN